MLELRAVLYMEGGAVAFCDEAEADAFGLFLVEDTELNWIADFADYRVALQFAEDYAEDTELVFIDRVRSAASKLP